MFDIYQIEHNAYPSIQEGVPLVPTKTTRTAAYAKVNVKMFFLSQNPRMKANMTTAADVVIRLFVRDGLRAIMTIGTIRAAAPLIASIAAIMESARRVKNVE